MGLFRHAPHPQPRQRFVAPPLPPVGGPVATAIVSVPTALGQKGAQGTVRAAGILTATVSGRKVVRTLLVMAATATGRKEAMASSAGGSLTGSQVVSKKAGRGTSVAGMVGGPTSAAAKGARGSIETLVGTTSLLAGTGGRTGFAQAKLVMGSALAGGSGSIPQPGTVGASGAARDSVGATGGPLDSGGATGGLRDTVGATGG